MWQNTWPFTPTTTFIIPWILALFYSKIEKFKKLIQMKLSIWEKWMDKVRNKIFHEKYHLYYTSTLPRIIFLHKDFSQRNRIKFLRLTVHIQNTKIVPIVPTIPSRNAHLRSLSGSVWSSSKPYRNEEWNIGEIQSKTALKQPLR